MSKYRCKLLVDEFNLILSVTHCYSISLKRRDGYLISSFSLYVAPQIFVTSTRGVVEDIQIET